MHFVVTFCSKEESQKSLSLAVKLAAATLAHITVLKVVPEPQSVGVVAELIATDEPFLVANEELSQIVEELLSENLEADSVVWKADEVGKGIVSAVAELGADLVFVGTRDVSKSTNWFSGNDPIAHYIVEHCPANVVLVRE